MPAARRSAADLITPITLPTRVRTLLVFGGSFDPPHFYHTIGPLSVVRRLYGPRGWVLYVPAAQSPHKPDGPHASDEHRLAMLRLALDLPGPRSIWTDEIDRARRARERSGATRAPASYTIDTLRRLRRVLPATVSLRLLIGSDQVAAFHRWKRPREIIRLAEPLVMVREPVVTASSLYSSLDREFWTLDERRAWCTRLAPNFPMEPSSTAVRDAIPGASRNAERWENHSRLSGIATSVAEYIIEHNLYGFRPGPIKPARSVPEPSGDEPGARRRVDRALAVGLARVARGSILDDRKDKRPKAKASGRRSAE